MHPCPQGCPKLLCPRTMAPLIAIYDCRRSIGVGRLHAKHVVGAFPSQPLAQLLRLRLVQHGLMSTATAYFWLPDDHEHTVLRCCPPNCSPAATERIAG